MPTDKRELLRALAWALGAGVAALAACRLESAPSAYRPDALYRRYCASCHGLAGKGDGPVAALFTVPPPDLTRLAERYGDTELVDVVRQAIDGRRPIRAHGEADMPVWGEFFADEFKSDRISRRPGLPKAYDIARYVATQLQEQGAAHAPEGTP
ncbi:MAG: cytochrome c [Thermodesulfobacteriota bacterium]|jgi:mono/diheme cytochrome c family protein